MDTKADTWLDIGADVAGRDGQKLGALKVMVVHPAESIVLPAGTYYPEPVTVHLNAPAGTAPITEGMAVRTREGERVGSVDVVVTDHGGTITGYVIRHGFVLGHDIWIDRRDFAGVRSGEVILHLTKDELDRLDAEQNDGDP